jgi:hypothetical protein
MSVSQCLPLTRKEVGMTHKSPFIECREGRVTPEMFLGFLEGYMTCWHYAKAVLKFAKLNTAAQQREAVTRGRSLLPYRLRYTS